MAGRAAKWRGLKRSRLKGGMMSGSPASTVEEPKQVTFWPGNPLSYTTTKIVCYYNEVHLGDATGFIFKAAQRYALVTNWHVVSGRNPITGQALDRTTGCVPNRIKFHAAIELDDETKRDLVHFREFILPLYGEDGEPLWLDAKEDDNQRDIAVVPLNPHVPELANDAADIRAIHGGKVTLEPGIDPRHRDIQFEDLKHFLPPVGAEVFVLGYPKGITPNGIFPIWKRASIASEPQVGISLGDQDYEDAFYIDAMTNQGMSGSPVVYMARTGDMMFTKDNIGVQVKNDEPFLVGVYAGRNGVSGLEGDLALGRVWGVSLLERIVMSGGKAQLAFTLLPD